MLRRKIVLSLSGMTCTSCSNTIERALNCVQNVESSVVSLSTSTATIYLIRDQDEHILAELCSLIEGLGFVANVIEDLSQSSKELLADEENHMKVEPCNFLVTVDFKSLAMKSRCRDGIMATLKQLPGVIDASEIDLISGPKSRLQLKVTTDECILGARALVAAVKAQHMMEITEVKNGRKSIASTIIRATQIPTLYIYFLPVYDPDPRANFLAV
jgi:copper chaperone CopZ